MTPIAIDPADMTALLMMMDECESMTQEQRMLQSNLTKAFAAQMPERYEQLASAHKITPWPEIDV